MTALARGAGSHGAETTISGEISIEATWTEDIYFYDPSDGSAMSLTGLGFRFQFRADPDQTDADVTLSTAGASPKLSLVADGGGVTSILRIAAAAGTFDDYEGDMIADLIAIDQSSNITHYGHGVVSFRNSPVAP